MSQNIKALVVDDEIIARTVHEDILKNLGCSVEIATDGHQALRVWQSGFDLILLDNNMPGIKGIDVVKRIRSIEKIVPISPLIIIGITADDEIKELCLEAGMNYVLPKPISKRDIEQIVNSIRNNKK